MHQNNIFDSNFDYCSNLVQVTVVGMHLTFWCTRSFLRALTRFRGKVGGLAPFLALWVEKKAHKTLKSEMHANNSNLDQVTAVIALKLQINFLRQNNVKKRKIGPNYP